MEWKRRAGVVGIRDGKDVHRVMRELGGKKIIGGW